MIGFKWLSKEELTEVKYYPEMEPDWFFKRTYSELTYKIKKKNKD